GRLARTLGTELLSDVGRRIEQDHAANPDARDLLMRARALQRQALSADAYREALNLLEKALILDPTSVEARLRISGFLVTGIWEGWSGSAEQDKARADDLIREALEREPNLAYAHGLKGQLRQIQG